MPKGNFFVFEGIDGSGKSTQSNLLSDFLKNQGRKVEKIDFPQYGKKSAALLENYLTGLYGTAEEVGAYRSSIFFVSDRYDVSNVGHQGGKLIHNKQEWEKYVDWLYDLEYNIFKIPRPDYTFILKISPELSMKMSNKITDPEKIKKRIAYLGDDKKQDIHESDKQHLADTLESYIEIAKKFPEEFKVIDCQQDEEFLPINVIQEKIKKLVQEKIN